MAMEWKISSKGSLKTRVENATRSTSGSGSEHDNGEGLGDDDGSN